MERQALNVVDQSSNNKSTNSRSTLVQHVSSADEIIVSGLSFIKLVSVGGWVYDIKIKFSKIELVKDANLTLSTVPCTVVLLDLDPQDSSHCNILPSSELTNTSSTIGTA